MLNLVDAMGTSSVHFFFPVVDSWEFLISCSLMFVVKILGLAMLYITTFSFFIEDTYLLAMSELVMRQLLSM